MAESHNIVTIYEECIRALRHFEEHYENLQRHTLLFRKNTKVYEHTNTLSKVYMYLENSSWHAITDTENYSRSLSRIDSFLSDKTLEAAATARREESNLLRCLIEALLFTRVYLLDDMTKAEFLTLVVGASHEEVQYLCRMCKQEIQSNEEGQHTLTIKYNNNVEKTKVDLKAELIALEYTKNKRLNKFEQQTHKRIRDLVVHRLDEEWKDHLEKLPELQMAVARQAATTQRWKDKVSLLESVIYEGVKGETHDLTNESTGGNDIHAAISSAIERQLLVDNNIGKIGSRQIEVSNQVVNAETVSPTAELLDAPHKTLGHVCFDSCPNANCPVSKMENTIVIAMPATTSTWQTTSVTAENDLHDNVDNTGELNTTELEESRKGTALIQEDSFCFITKREYEYEHNRENRPIVSLPAIDKATWSKAFAGLDKYAQDLYSRSPATTSKSQ